MSHAVFIHVHRLPHVIMNKHEWCIIVCSLYIRRERVKRTLVLMREMLISLMHSIDPETLHLQIGMVSTIDASFLLV